MSTKKSKPAKKRAGVNSVPTSNFAFEFDAPDVHPSNVDAVAFLEYAAAYLEGLRLAARLQDGELTFSGVELVDKCVQVRSNVNNPDLGWTCVTTVDNFVAGTVLAPRKMGLMSQTKAIIAARERLTDTLPSQKRAAARFTVRVAEHVHTLRPPPAQSEDSFRYRSIETIRAKIERLSGGELKARLDPVVGKPFIVDLASEEQALEVRHHWLDEVDVDVEVEVALGGAILKGRLLRFHPLSEQGSVQAWRDWVDPEVRGDGRR